ncbi:MAG: tetratricopeptide repeat protein [Aureispira sp.]|nr:tetratricopeptide repeat protein [Aureispira sp.]
MTRKNFLSLTFTLIGFVYTSYAQDYQKYMSFSYQEIDSLVMTFYQKGDYQECLLSMQSARANAQADFGEQDSTFAEYTTNVSFFYSKIGAYDKAILLSKQAINVQEKIMGREHSSYTNSLSNLATLHFKMGNVEKALPIFQQIVKIEEKTLGKEHPEFAISLSNLARLHQELGDYDKALALYLELIKIREKTLGKEHHKFASTLNNLGYLYSEIGDLEQALPLYIQAKDIIGKVFGEEHPNVATALNNLAVLYTKMGDWDKALPLYIQAKDIIGKALGEEHPDFAIALNNLANFYQQLGNNNKSLKLQKQALDIEGKQLGKEHPQYATSLNNLAELYVRMNKYEEALPLLIQAVGIQKRNFGEEHPEVAGALNNLAYLYADMDKNAQALLLYTEAIKIIEKTLGKEHPQYAMSIGNLAELHIGMNNYNQSWSVLLKGIEALTQLRMSANVNQAWADSLYQVKYVSIQHIEKMVAILDYTYDLLEKDTTVGSSSQKQIVLADLALQFLTKLQNKVSNENDKLRFLEKSNAWLVKSLKKLNPTEQPSKAFNLSDGYKSVLLLRATKAENTYRLGELPDSLILQDKKRLKKQSELQAKLLEKRPKSEKDSLRNQLISVNEDIDDFLLLVKEKYPKYHKLKYQQIKTKAKDIQKLLDDKTALLEYVVTDSVLHIFYLDKNIIEWEQSLVSSKKLNGNIQEFHDALSNYPLIVKDSEEAYSQYIQKAHWFYQKLLKPVLKGKVNINNLIVITDGKLGHLPFETLLVEQAPQKITAYNKLHYLVTDVTQKMD